MSDKSKLNLKKRWPSRPRQPIGQDAYALDIPSFQKFGGPSRSSIYELAKKGHLEMFNDISGRAMITGKSARAMLHAPLPDEVEKEMA
jgi:hypothetical protein